MRVPTGERLGIEVGVIPEDAVLRFGVYAPAASNANPRILVRAGERTVASYDIEPGPRWTDHRISLAEHAGETCQIVLEGLAGAWLSPCELIVPEQQTRPNVLMILIDTLRKDHVGAYGYARNTSPVIDALAKDGVVVDELMPQSSWTRPSVASMLTSTYPNIHGALDWPDVVRPEVPRFADAMERADYETHALLGNPQVLPVWGLGGEFVRCVDVNALLGKSAEDAELIEAAIKTVEFTEGRPWFMYLHLLGPHEPYTPPEPFRSQFAQDHAALGEREAEIAESIDLYDGEIAFTDSEIGRLIDILKRQGRYDNTLILIVSDHGEEFWEHGNEFHGNSLYEEVLDVPLILKLPKNEYAGQRRTGLVEGIDLAPTVLEWIGAPPEPRFQGRSFAALLRGETFEDRTGYASLFYKLYSMRGAKRGPAKYIHDYAAQREEWFDLEADPAELQPLHEANDATLAQHVSRIDARGAAGLHLMITCGDTPHEITGTIAAQNPPPAQMRYYDSKYTMQQDETGIRFTMRTHDGMDEKQNRDEWHEEHAEQANAHLLIPIAIDQAFAIELKLNGSAFPNELTIAGANERTIALDGSSIEPASILAAPEAFDPNLLPRKFALYLWYVADVERISEAEMDPELSDALKSLGYIE